jgi:hypothetical protein
MAIIVVTTNSYATRVRQNREERKTTRNWKPVNPTDI